MPGRREFIKMGGIAGIGLASGDLVGLYSPPTSVSTASLRTTKTNELQQSIIGLYGPWAASLNENKIPSHSFRNSKYKNVKSWQTEARNLLLDRMNVPDLGGTPEVKVNKQYNYDGLHIEELSWQLPYGRVTKAVLMKPENATGKLPAILAFHCHGGNKYFGHRKITKTGDDQLPVLKEYQEHYYGGKAWANEIARRGYVVLVHDAFTFGSRRVMMEDVPEFLREGLTDQDPENEQNIDKYNRWASNHEHVMAKSLFCAGTTWPSVFFAEDRKALDVLSARADVDASRIGCGGLSGGGLRTDYMAGLDPRIKCSVSVGFMTTWKDLLLNKSYTHTWMTYVPQVPNALDFPEILGLRAPAATMVLNDAEDQLYTMPEMKEADRILTEVYKKAGASDRYKCSFYPGPHKFDQPMQQEAFAWWDKWLKA